MAAIFQTTFSNAFSWMEMNDEFWLRFRWSLFISFQLTIFQHWFRWWLGAGQATSHCLKQWWLIHWCIYVSLPQWVDNISALVEIMAWRRPGTKPLSKPMMVSLLMHICFTWPKWVTTIHRDMLIKTRGHSLTSKWHRHNNASKSYQIYSIQVYISTHSHNHQHISTDMNLYIHPFKVMTRQHNNVDTI